MTGIRITGSDNRLTSSQTGSQQGNKGNGIVVEGTGNILDENKSLDNGGLGVLIAGMGNQIRKNEAKKNENGGIARPCQFDIGPGNIDGIIENGRAKGAGQNKASGDKFSFGAGGGKFPVTCRR